MKILCAVDGSEFSQWAITALGALGRDPLTSMTLLHVADTRHLKQAGSPHITGYRGAKAALEKAGEQLLRQAAHQADEALSQSAINPRTAIRSLLLEGNPASTIAQLAARGRYNLIIVGTRGLSDVKGFLMGSTSRKVAAIASCPVLVVKRPMGMLNRVFLAVDDSRHSRRAARFLRSGILPETSSITIFSAVQAPLTELAARYLSQADRQTLIRPAADQAERLVGNLRDDFLKEGYTVSTDIEINHVIESIIKHIKSSQTDLLVIGSRGLTKRERLYLGSVSESLLKHAPCSVLIVRGARV